MAISHGALRNAARRYTGPRVHSIPEAKSRGLKSGFLSHSHKDADLAKGVIEVLRDNGLEIYVDWEDTEMPEQPDRETAKRIRQKIVVSDLFLFLATDNSMRSRWCPWEIGYADGTKPIDTIMVIPTNDSYTTYGNEYLQLYRRIDELTSGNLQFYEAGDYTGHSLRALT